MSPDRSFPKEKISSDAHIGSIPANQVAVLQLLGKRSGAAAAGTETVGSATGNPSIKEMLEIEILWLLM